VSLLTVPFGNFVAGSTIVSAQVNANNAAIVAWSTNIDTLNIGAAGISISKLVGTAATLATGNDSIALPGGAILKWGKVTGVLADGSSTVTINFTSAFPNNLLSCGVFVSNNFQTNPWGLAAPQTNTEGVGGFKFDVAGAPAASIVNCFWFAVGN
jgi:hypothetical protein